jgi:hypothetical protein
MIFFGWGLQLEEIYDRGAALCGRKVSQMDGLAGSRQTPSRPPIALNYGLIIWVVIYLIDDAVERKIKPKTQAC